MSSIWIFILLPSLALSDNALNNLVASETSTPVPLNEVTYFAAPDTEFSNMMVPNQLQLKNQPINTDVSDCPNTDVLLTILNILTRSLPNGNKSLMEPEKFKYVLTIVKNLLEKTQHSPDYLTLQNKLKNLEEHVGKINIPTTVSSLRDRAKNKVKAKISLQYELPSRHQNCQDISNNLINLINLAYLRVMKYCEVTGNCNGNYINDIPNIYGGYNPYYINALNNIPLQESKNKLNKVPLSYSKKESILASNDLINFIKNQEAKGIHNIMTILQNYRPKGDFDTGHGIKDSAPFKESQLYISPENIFGINKLPQQHLNPNLNIPSGPSQSLIPLPELNTKETPIKTIPWQSIANSYGNQEYSKLLAQKFYSGQNVGISNSVNTGMESYGLVNGQIIPVDHNNPSINWKKNINTGLLNNPTLNPVESNKNIDYKTLYEIMKFFANAQQQKASHVDEKLLSKLPSVLPKQYYTNPSLLGSNIHENTKFTNYPYNMDSKLESSNQNILNTFLSKQLTQPSTYQPYSHFNQIVSPFVGTFADNKEQVNYDNRLLDLNQLPGITNLGKLNSIPNNNGVVELTYMLERPQPVSDPLYYVKYRLPYQTFLYNLQNLLIKKPYLRNEPNLLFQEMLVGSNITDTSNDLKGLGYEEIIKLTTTNGTLVTAKILENNDLVVDETLKIVQKLNSNLPVENIINLNRNTPDSPSLDLKKFIINDTVKDTVENAVVSKPPLFLADVQRRLGLNQYLYNPYKLNWNYNPYGVYQVNPPINELPYYKYGYNLLKSNALNVPSVYSQSLLSTYPKFTGHGR